MESHSPITHISVLALWPEGLAIAASAAYFVFAKNISASNLHECASCPGGFVPRALELCLPPLSRFLAEPLLHRSHCDYPGRARLWCPYLSPGSFLEGAENPWLLADMCCPILPVCRVGIDMAPASALERQAGAAAPFRFNGWVLQSRPAQALLGNNASLLGLPLALAYHL
jgi:hypothetical protein